MKRIVLPLLFAVMLLAPLGLTGCGDSTCDPDQVVAALEKMQKVADAMTVPAERIQNIQSPDKLGPIKEQFQGLRDEAALIEIPECMTEAKFEMIATYDSYIKAVEAAERDDFDAANQGLEEAEEHFRKFEEALEEVGNRL